MTPELLFKLVAISLFTLGLYGLAAQPHLLRKILALNLMSVGVFLFLVSTAARGGTADPVPQAMVITGIVVSVSATALALTLVSRIHRESGRARLYWWSGRREDEEHEE